MVLTRAQKARQAQPQPQPPPPPPPPPPAPPAPPKPKPKPREKPAPKRPAPKETAASTSGVKKPRVPRAGKKKPAAEKKKKKKKGEQDDDDDEVVSGSDEQPAEPTGGNGDAGDQEAGAAINQRQLDRDARLTPRSLVTHDPEPVPEEVRFDPPGYDGSRRNLGRLVDRKEEYFIEAAFKTAPGEFEYRGVRWVHAALINSGSFGKAE